MVSYCSLLGADFVIMADGNSLISKKTLGMICQDKKLVSLDGASNKLFKMGITPDIIIGDGDSIDKTVQAYYQSKKTPIIFDYDQNKTDIEKAIIFCDAQNTKSITIINALWGGRTDHSLGNISCLRKFYDPIHS